MASGDAQRAWFPEMLSILRERWHPRMSWEEMSLLCDEMQSLRDEIREKKNIGPVRMYCKECGQYSEVTPLRVGIRSLLFALKKVDIISTEQFKALDKDWKKYRKENNLDPYGQSSTKSQDQCNHRTGV